MRIQKLQTTNFANCDKSKTENQTWKNGIASEKPQII